MNEGEGIHYKCMMKAGNIKYVVGAKYVGACVWEGSVIPWALYTHACIIHVYTNMYIPVQYYGVFGCMCTRIIIHVFRCHGLHFGPISQCHI